MVLHIDGKPHHVVRIQEHLREWTTLFVCPHTDPRRIAHAAHMVPRHWAESRPRAPIRTGGHRYEWCEVSAS